MLGKRREELSLQRQRLQEEAEDLQKVGGA